ncbi:MAG: DUF948 domain-containing protein [Nanoarchaeota archaeon]
MEKMDMDYTEEGRKKFYTIVERARNQINESPADSRESMLKIIDDVMRVYEIYAVEHPKCEAGFPLLEVAYEKLLGNLQTLMTIGNEAKSKLEREVIPTSRKTLDMVNGTNTLTDDIKSKLQKIRLGLEKPKSDAKN